MKRTKNIRYTARIVALLVLLIVSSCPVSWATEVTFKVHGVDDVKLTYTAGVAYGTLPVARELKGFHFVGWSTSEVAWLSDWPADLVVTNESIVPASDITLYALYAETNMQSESFEQVTNVEDLEEGDRIVIGDGRRVMAEPRLSDWSMNSLGLDYWTTQYSAFPVTSRRNDYARVFTLAGNNTDGFTLQSAGGYLSLTDIPTQLTLWPTADANEQRWVFSMSGQQAVIESKTAQTSNKYVSETSSNGTHFYAGTYGYQYLCIYKAVTYYTYTTAPAYAVYYDLDGGCGTTSTFKKKTGGTVTIPSETPVKEGYTFDHWTDGTTDYQPGGSVNLDAANTVVTLKAIYTVKQHTITIDTECGINITASASGSNVNYMTCITLTQSSGEGHQFTAWNVYKTGNEDTKVTVTPRAYGDVFRMPDYDVTISATTEALHTLTVTSNDEDLGEVSASILTGYKDYCSWLTATPKSPNTFLRWEIVGEAHGAELRYPEDINKARVIFGNGDITLRALFAPAPVYTIEWYANGVLFDTTHVTKGEHLRFPTNDPSYPEYAKTFLGWHDGEYNSTDVEPTYVKGSDEVTGNKTFYAVFGTVKSGIGVARCETTFPINGDVLTSPYVDKRATWAFKNVLFGEQSDAYGFCSITEVTIPAEGNLGQIDITPTPGVYWGAGNTFTNVYLKDKDGAVIATFKNGLDAQNKPDQCLSYTFKGTEQGPFKLTADNTGYNARIDAITFYYFTSVSATFKDFTTGASPDRSHDLAFAEGQSYAGLYLDYAVTVPDGVHVYYATVDGSNNISLQKLTGDKIPANTGVVVKRIEAADAGNVTFNETKDAVSPIADNALTGSASQATAKDLYDANSGKGVYRMTSVSNTQIRFDKLDNNTQLIEAHESLLLMPSGADDSYTVTNNDGVLNVTITAAGWATAYVPFKATVSGATAYKVSVSDGSLTKTSVTVIPAGTGVLLSGDEGTAVFTETLADADDVSGNMMIGTAQEGGETFNVADTKYYILANDAQGIGFYWQNGTGGTSVNCAQYKAVLAVGASQSNNVRGFALGGSTSVDQTLDDSDITDVYDLAGRRVTGNADKGIYIVNGKKLYVK